MRVVETLKSDNSIVYEKYKKVTLSVKCAADWPDRHRLQEKLIMDILDSGLKLDEKIILRDYMRLEYLVAPDHEQRFRALAQKHGFKVCEVLVA